MYNLVKYTTKVSSSAPPYESNIKFQSPPIHHSAQDQLNFSACFSKRLVLGTMHIDGGLGLLGSLTQRIRI